MCKFKKPEIPANITADERRAIMFNALSSLDLNDKLEKRENDKLSYLSWANAWAEFKAAYPSATYQVIKNPETKLPYFTDPNVGIMVFTEVTVDNLTHSMWLPVMDAKNKAMKLTPYTYQVWDSYKKAYTEKTVTAATMFDINKTLMRCLVKNLAMFGLGLYVYAGEDIPTDNTADGQNDSTTSTANTTKKAATRRTATKTTATAQQKSLDKYAGIRAAVNSCISQDQLASLYYQHQNEVNGNEEVKAIFTQRKLQLQQAA